MKTICKFGVMEAFRIIIIFLLSMVALAAAILFTLYALRYIFLSCLLPKENVKFEAACYIACGLWALFYLLHHLS